MKPMNQETKLEARYRTMLTLWLALFISLGMFFLLAVLVPGPPANENQMLSLAFAAAGTVAVITSYFVKQRLLAQAAATQNIILVQQSMIVAAALCEVAVMLGLIDHFITGNRYYYCVMLVGVIGGLLNFPRRDHLLAASYKKPLN